MHVLNHDGNLLDAASVAAISALSHFRRPDVSAQGHEATVVRLVTPERHAFTMAPYKTCTYIVR